MTTIHLKGLIIKKKAQLIIIKIRHEQKISDNQKHSDKNESEQRINDNRKEAENNQKIEENNSKAEDKQNEKNLQEKIDTNKL